jgi:flagellar protein FlaJ
LSKSPTPSEPLRRLRESISRAVDIAAKPFKYLLQLYLTSLVKGFEAYIVGSGISTSLERYVATSSRILLATSVALFSLALVVLLRVLPLSVSLVVSATAALVIAPALSSAVLIYLPVAVYKNRGEVLESKALQLLSALALLTASGQSVYKVFEALPRVLGGDYKVFSVELDLASSLVKVGVPVDEALKRVAEITPSPTLRDLFLSLSSIISIGGNVAQVVWSLVERYVTRYGIRVERSVEALNVFMEVYVAIALMIPILVGSTAALLLIYPIAGISFEALMVLTTLILVPISSAAIVTIADVIVSRVRP